jgi:serine/threonine-protein kinase HipA
VSRHALSINGKRSNITREDLLTIGKSIKNKKAAETIDHIGSVIKNWKEFADAVEVSPTLRDEIAETLIRL